MAARIAGFAGVVVAVLLLDAGGARAFDLVPGSYGEIGGAQDLAATTLKPARQASAQDPAIDFTPRHASSLWPDDAASPSVDAGPLRFELSVGDNDLGDRLGLTESPSMTRGHAASRYAGNLSVGGAMRWSDWTVGGAYARTDLLGADVDIMSAILGYGRLSAELSYGQGTDYDANPVDVLMLSTEVSPWSWLTLESDLALGERGPEAESVAVGRLGVRLNF